MPCRRAHSFKPRHRTRTKQLRIQTKRLPSQTKRSSMMRVWSQAAILLVLIPVLGQAQTGFVRNSFISPYKVKPVPPVNLQNSQRIFDLLRAGQLYLSLADAITLALENNLDLDRKSTRLNS